MRGEQYLKTAAQFGLVRERGRSWVSGPMVARVSANGLGLSRYGFAASRRVGKAVVRNRVKRRLREILRETPLRPGWDIVFMARPSAAKASYTGLKESARGLLRRAGVLAGGYEGVCPGAN